ncbi:hypothetical protein BGX33_001893 [Mortierella sp. NVP41]|nr:hypothetical protein BGX33_001893 [Mortierella sp. NVP41]
MLRVRHNRPIQAQIDVVSPQVGPITPDRLKRTRISHDAIDYTDNNPRGQLADAPLIRLYNEATEQIQNLMRIKILQDGIG